MRRFVNRNTEDVINSHKILTDVLILQYQQTSSPYSFLVLSIALVDGI